MAGIAGQVGGLFVVVGLALADGVGQHSELVVVAAGALGQGGYAVVAPRVAN